MDAEAKPIAAVEMGVDANSKDQQDAAAQQHAAVAKETVQISVKADEYSIYDLWNVKQRYTVLLAAAFATLLMPLSDTVYLPSLYSIQMDLETTSSLVALTVSIYMFVLGAFCLFWGPLSDRFGRRYTVIAGCAAFIGATIVCVFAPSIGVLVAFRALQGAFVGSFGAVGSGALADVFPPEQRGTASGIFTIPIMAGPVIGPVIGGGIAEAFGWRGCFVALAIMAGIALLILLFLFPETHQYLKLQTLAKTEPQRADAIAAAAGVQKPAYLAPWGALLLLLKRDVAPHLLVALVLFGSVFISLTELPLFLYKPPYSLSQSVIGLCYLPSGIASFLGSTFGGKLSDAATNRFSASIPGFSSVETRLLPGTLVALVIGVPAFVLFGWALEYGLPLPVVLVAHCLTGLATGVYVPGLSAFLSIKNQHQASAAASAFQSYMFIISGIMIYASAEIVRAIGAGATLTGAAGICFVCISVSLVMVVVCIRKEVRRSAEERGQEAAPKA